MCEWGTDAMVRLCVPMPVSGRTEIGVDACIAPLVQALNDGGIATISCCCGHGKDPGRIDLADGRVLLVMRFSPETDPVNQPESIQHLNVEWLEDFIERAAHLQGLERAASLCEEYAANVLSEERPDLAREVARECASAIRTHASYTRKV